MDELHKTLEQHLPPDVAKEVSRMLYGNPCRKLELPDEARLLSGKEDFDLSKELQLPVLDPINAEGIYYNGFGFLTGKFAGNVADEVLDELRKRNVYYKKSLATF